jgi:hypothetical protein
MVGRLPSLASARRQYWCNWMPPAIAALDSGGAGKPMTCEKNCGAVAIGGDLDAIGLLVRAGLVV